MMRIRVEQRFYSKVKRRVAVVFCHILPEHPQAADLASDSVDLEALAAVFGLPSSNLRKVAF